MHMASRCVLVGLALTAPAAAGQPAADARTEPLLTAMQELARQTTVRRKGAPETEPAEWIPKPVFRYSDQPRRIVDATLWLWTENGRPVAMQKVEAMERAGRPAWTYCFATFSPDVLEVRWPSGRTYESRQGVEFKTLPNPPAAEASTRLAGRQLRQVARRFRAEITNTPDGSEVEQMRLLPRPIFEYGGEQSDVLAGAVFGFASNGTNPDAYLILEVLYESVGDSRWRYDFARMTTGGLTFRLDDREVCSAPWVQPQPKAFETWTFFFEPRSVDQAR